jgi:hypothetical protein
VGLSAREFYLLKAFADHPGQVLSRQELLSMAWDIDFDPQTNIVDLYVGYLRRNSASPPSPPSAEQATACQPAASQHHPTHRTVTGRADHRTGQVASAAPGG